MATKNTIDMGAVSQLLRDAKELYALAKSISNNESVDQDDIDNLEQLISDCQNSVSDLAESIEDEAEENDE